MNDICAENDGNPIQTKERQRPEELEIVVPAALRMSNWVVVKDDHRFGTNGIWIFVLVVCKIMVVASMKEAQEG